MIVDERIITFINSMDTENSEILETIEQEALAADVPIIRREMQSFLEVLLLMKKPMRVLEVGTAVGFSALLMSDYLPEGGHITTIENYEKRIPIARENFRRAGKEDKITLIEGDATEVLAEMEGTFDFIFMDVMMPVMDGLEATKRIRALPSAYAKKIPILAMTANAFQEDRQSCLEVGMNGHIAKPLKKEDIIKELLRSQEAK